MQMLRRLHREEGSALRLHLPASVMRVAQDSSAVSPTVTAHLSKAFCTLIGRVSRLFCTSQVSDRERSDALACHG